MTLSDRLRSLACELLDFAAELDREQVSDKLRTTPGSAPGNGFSPVGKAAGNGGGGGGSRERERHLKRAVPAANTFPPKGDAA